MVRRTLRGPPGQRALYRRRQGRPGARSRPARDTCPQRLEERRWERPKTVTDRGIRYTQHYDLGGGLAWSRSFSAASKRALGWSTGAHGLRHKYAQERLDELQGDGYEYNTALETVSQEMGHFRADITEVYLR